MSKWATDDIINNYSTNPMYLINVELFEKLNGTRDNTFRALLGGLKSVQDNP